MSKPINKRPDIKSSKLELHDVTKQSERFEWKMGGKGKHEILRGKRNRSKAKMPSAGSAKTCNFQTLQLYSSSNTADSMHMYNVTVRTKASAALLRHLTLAPSLCGASFVCPPPFQTFSLKKASCFLGK